MGPSYPIATSAANLDEMYAALFDLDLVAIEVGAGESAKSLGGELEYDPVGFGLAITRRSRTR